MPVAELNASKGRIDVYTSFIEREQISQLPGARYDRTDKIWHAPLSWATCIVLRGLFGESLEVGPELHKWTWREFQERVGPAKSLRDALSLSADDAIAVFIDAVEEGLMEK